MSKGEKGEIYKSCEMGMGKKCKMGKGKMGIGKMRKGKKGEMIKGEMGKGTIGKGAKWAKWEDRIGRNGKTE